MVTISRVRRELYRWASILGDVGAVASLSPKRVVKRYIRKRLWRAGTRAARRAERDIGL